MTLINICTCLGAVIKANLEHITLVKDDTSYWVLVQGVSYSISRDTYIRIEEELDSTVGRGAF